MGNNINEQNITPHARGPRKTQKTNKLTEEHRNKLTGRKTEKPRKVKVANERRNETGRRKNDDKAINKTENISSPPAFLGLQP